jgi:H/ACA ribonucleoprotein complex subunit 3
MRYMLRICTNCKRYTLKEICSICNNKTNIAHPPKFSPDDKYIRYRITKE